MQVEQFYQGLLCLCVALPTHQRIMMMTDGKILSLRLLNNSYCISEQLNVNCIAQKKKRGSLLNECRHFSEGTASSNALVILLGIGKYPHVFVHSIFKCHLRFHLYL
jgi:hypothetical protein